MHSCRVAWLHGIHFKREQPFDEALPQATLPLVLAKAFIRAFMSAYEDARRLRARGAKVFARRAFPRAGAALVQTAVASARMREQLTPRQLAVIQAASNMLDNPGYMIGGSFATPPDSLRQFERIASEVAIVGPRVFQFADELPEMVSSGVTSYPNETLADDFVHTLANALYLKYYCGLRAPIRPGSTGGDLLSTLQAANTSVAGWDGGWEIVSRDTNGRVVVRRGTRTRLMAAQDVHGPGDHEAADGPVSIRRTREDNEVSARRPRTRSARRSAISTKIMSARAST